MFRLCLLSEFHVTIPLPCPIRKLETCSVELMVVYPRTLCTESDVLVIPRVIGQPAVAPLPILTNNTINPVPTILHLEEQILTLILVF